MNKRKLTLPIVCGERTCYDPSCGLYCPLLRSLNSGKHVCLAFNEKLEGSEPYLSLDPSIMRLPWCLEAESHE